MKSKVLASFKFDESGLLICPECGEKYMHSGTSGETCNLTLKSRIMTDQRPIYYEILTEQRRAFNNLSDALIEFAQRIKQ